MRTGWPAKTPAARIQPWVPPGRGSGAAVPPVRPASRATALARAAASPMACGTWMTISSGSGERARPGMPDGLDEVGGGADQADMGVQQGVPARGGGGHDDAPSAVPGVTASLGIVPGMGMTFANDAGPRRNAAAPPSPAAAGSWSRSAPAARMPRTVR